MKPQSVNVNLLKAQMIALSDQFEAMQSQLAAIMSAIEPECAHENKKDIGTIGSEPTFHCPDCGLEWAEEEES